MSFGICTSEGEETVNGEASISLLFDCTIRRPGPELLRNGDRGFLAIIGEPCPSFVDADNEEILKDSAEDLGIFLSLRGTSGLGFNALVSGGLYLAEV